MAKSEMDRVTDMVEAVKSIVDAPAAYAGTVLDDVMSTAKAARPNTEGLFDFSSGAQLDATMPRFDFSDLMDRLALPNEAVGRWAESSIPWPTSTRA